MRAAGLVLAAVLLVAGESFAQTFTYELYVLEGGNRVLLSRGEVPSSATDTHVTPVPLGKVSWLDKELRLPGGFSVGLSDHAEKDASGIGLWMRGPAQGGFRGFSWEWFDQADGERFTKRQGGGGIELHIVPRDGLEYVDRVDFLSDVLFRMNAERGAKPGTITHVMVIRKGSVLAFSPLASPAQTHTTYIPRWQ